MVKMVGEKEVRRRNNLAASSLDGWVFHAIANGFRRTEVGNPVVT